MDSFGEYLKRERELRGVTLEEISKTSNISKTFLKSLENDDFENLPAEVFVKGFIRCYAENTGMDGNEAILAYNSFIANKRSSETVSEVPTEIPAKSNVKMPYLLAIAIFVVVSSLAVFYYVEKNREIKPSSVSERNIPQNADEIGMEDSKNNIEIALDSNTTEEESLILLEGIDAQPPEESILEIIPTPPSTEIEETPDKKEVTDILTLSMIATEDAWISLAIDDAEKKEALLEAGETARWKAKEKFVVSLGNAAGTQLKLNGKEISLPKSSSNILRNFAITLDNIN